MHLKNFDPYDFEKHDVHGVPVYVKNLPWAPCIHVRIVFGTGAFDDPAGKEGLSHFFEHLAFNGSSPKFSDRKVIKEWSKTYTLGSWNAATNFYQVFYLFRCLPEHYETVLDGVKDLIFHNDLSAEDIEHERKVILQEAWKNFQNEKFLEYSKKVSTILFHGHEHERFVRPLGWPDTIQNISRDDIVTWHRAYYGIGNFFIVLAGAVEPYHIEALEKFLDDLPKVRPAHNQRTMVSRPKQNRLVSIADDIGQIQEQVEIEMMRILPAISAEKNQIVSLFSRLFQDILHERLRLERGLCYSVSAGVDLSKTYSTAYVSVKTEEKNIDIVEKEVRAILQEIQGKQHADRFEKIKILYKEQVESREDMSSGVVDTVLRDISRFGRVITDAEDIRLIEQATYADIAEFARHAFDPEYVFTDIVLPSKK
ncbi:MAG: insulinase family protein [Patescibacteria group bacterium]|nr:insulinase family protein [Patescibacteria group bacterium]MDE1945778.1 insulinase family protein [Patescibacteria group bacterium]